MHIYTFEGSWTSILVEIRLLMCSTGLNSSVAHLDGQFVTQVHATRSVNADIHWPRNLDAGLFAENLSQRGSSSSSSSSQSSSSSATRQPDH